MISLLRFFTSHIFMLTDTICPSLSMFPPHQSPESTLATSQSLQPRPPKLICTAVHVPMASYCSHEYILIAKARPPQLLVDPEMALTPVESWYYYMGNSAPTCCHLQVPLAASTALHLPETSSSSQTSICKQKGPP